MVVKMLHRKERFIITAIEIIDELGIQGLSTREIAKRQKVSEAALFHHFNNKNELLIAVLEHFSQFDHDIFQSAVQKKLEPRDAIRYMIGSHVRYYENYPAITSVMQIFDVLRNEMDLIQKVREITKNRTDYIKRFVEEAQKTETVDPAIDSENFADIIWGICLEICLKWRLDGQVFSLSERTLATLEMVFNAFDHRNKENVKGVQ